MNATTDHKRSVVQRFYGVKRWMYRTGRPGALARVMNRISAVQFAAGVLSPARAVTLEVPGRRTGRLVSFPVVVAEYEGGRYLVSMLGKDANWVLNVRAAGGRAVLRRGTREEVCLEEVEPGDRAPILRRYLALAPGARPHLPVDRHAPLEEFEKIANLYPVFRIIPSASTATHPPRRRPVHADITRLDLAARRRSLTGYTLGLAAYALVVVALYPAFKNTSSLDKLIHADPAAAALFGVTGTISSSGGWLDGNLYANFFPLILLLLTIGYGAASLAGQDEDGTLCLLTVLPVRRAAIVTQKIAAMAVQAAVLAAAVAACVIIGRSFQLSVTVGNAAAISLAAFLMAIDLGIVAMAAGALTGRRGTALGTGSALAAAS
jgi:ABC-2 type transport system permease protein